MAERDKPVKLGFIGTAIAVISGTALYHYFVKGTAPTVSALTSAMKDSPTDVLTGLTIGGLLALAFPSLAPYLSKLVSFFRIGKRALDTFPQELIDLLIEGIKAGEIDIRAILSQIPNIDFQSLMRLIQSLLSLSGKSSIISTDSTTTSSPPTTNTVIIKF